MGEQSSDFDLGADLLARIDAWRDAQPDRPTRAQAVGDLVRAGLRGLAAPSVSQGEKLILSMLCDVNRKLETKGMIDPDFLESAIQGGHIWAIEWQHPSLAHRHINSQADADFVVRTLTMWRLIEESFRLLPAEEKARIMEDAGLSAAPAFPGWHNVSETNYRSMARFMTDRMRLFPTMRLRASGPSDHVVAGKYKEMLKIFNALRDDVVDRNLAGSELAALLRCFRDAN